MKKTLQWIFAIYNKDGYKIFRFCGLQLKLKISNNKKTMKQQEYKNSYRIMRFYGVTNELISHLEFLNQSSFCWEYQNSRLWLVYIMCLLNLNNTQKALSILKKYVYYYPQLDNIEKFLPVSLLAVENGFSNSSVIKSAQVCKQIKKTNDGNLLYEILNNKKIAIVGNSPCEIGKNKGREIDNHDIIIRFNNFEINGFEKDYGSKTNIWCCNFMADIKPRNEKFDLIIIPESLKIRFVSNINEMYSAIDNNIPIYSFSNDLTYELTNSVYYSPTFGLRLIYGLSKILGTLNNVDFYGFNFCAENKENFTTHYFNDRDNSAESKRGTIHSLMDETEYLITLIKSKGGKI